MNLLRLGWSAGLICIVMGLSGCGWFADEHDVLAAQRTAGCSDVTGRFDVSTDLAFLPLMEGALEPEDRGGRNWRSLEISGNVATRLVLKVSEPAGMGGVTRSRTLVRDADFVCVDGWVQLPAGRPSKRYGAEGEPDRRPFTTTLQLGRNKAQGLLLKVRTERWEQVALFCYDGCNYMRIPGTTERTQTLTRWAVDKARGSPAGRVATFGGKPLDRNVARALAALPGDAEVARVVAQSPSQADVEFEWTHPVAMGKAGLVERLLEAGVQARVLDLKLNRDGQALGAVLSITRAPAD